MHGSRHDPAPTGADLPFEEVARLASEWGYDGLEIAVSGEHLDAWRWNDYWVPLVETPALDRLPGNIRDVLEAGQGQPVVGRARRVTGVARWRSRRR